MAYLISPLNGPLFNWLNFRIHPIFDAHSINNWCSYHSLWNKCRTFTDDSRNEFVGHLSLIGYSNCASNLQSHFILKMRYCSRCSINPNANQYESFRKGNKLLTWHSPPSAHVTRAGRAEFKQTVIHSYLMINEWFAISPTVFNNTDELSSNQF